jgi:hypothetical protein
VTLSASDTLSGVAKSQYKLDTANWTDYVPGSPVTVSGDGSHTVLYRSVDNAGNQEVDGTLTIQIDATAPTGVGGATARGADSNGWYNKPVAITFTGLDSLSGIATCTGTTYSGPDSAAATVSGTCTDKAGNTSATATFAFKYDATAPTAVIGAPDRAPNATGWYNAPVKVTFSGQDSVSTIGTCTSMTYSGPDTATATVSGTCTDTAGNVSAPVAVALKYDATKPTLVPAVAPNPVLLGGTATATPNASDATSGIAAQSCGAVVTGSAGAKTVTCTATDNAGNTNSAAAPYTVGYKVCLLYDPTKSVKSGATIPLKVQLCDASGADVSSASLTPHATGLTQVDTSASATVVDAGNANPDSDFRYDSTLGGYIYNLKTTGLATGTWKLTFTATGDPTSYSIQFDVR